MDDPFLRDQIPEGLGGGGNVWGGMRGLRGVRAPIRGVVRMNQQDPLLYSMMGLLPTPSMNQQGFNPFRPMMPDWGSGGYWDRQNQFGQQRALMSQSQAPDRNKIDFLQNLFGPNGAMGKLLAGLPGMMGGMGAGGMGGMMGMQSVNSPQGFSLGPLLQQMAR